MRNLVTAVTLALVGLGTACGVTNPAGPSGAIYQCKTQPRWYFLPDGTARQEIDTYFQSEPCPRTPIR